jgi:small subunit ribosomal protein S25
MEIHYNMFFRYYEKPKYSDPHVGLREFYFWEVPHIQYKNPGVQIVRFLEMSPIPFIRCWFDDGKDVLFDCDSKDRTSILDQLTKTLGKSKELLELEESLRQIAGKSKKENPAIFGYNQKRFCMCEIPDQVPCPGVIELPMRMRGKYRFHQKEKLEEWENDLDLELPDQKAMKIQNKWFPVKHEPPLTEIPGFEKIYLRKPKQKPDMSMDSSAAKLVKENEVQGKLDRYFEKKGKMVKYVSKNYTS